ncbi:MAG: FIST C-terminal domain-containing protein [Burkholderiales bacterium]|nr:FIST C-terminal domain-containing protein [Burkholderiales bacterium]
MNLFPFGHATHPQWPMAAGLVIAQLRAQMTLPGHASSPRLCLLYITDYYANDAEAILAHLQQELPMVKDWAGTVGVGVAANNAEYFDEPGMVLMLCDLPAKQYRVFSGAQPLPPSFQAASALVHADPQTPDLAELIAEMASRTQKGYLFGGLTASRKQAVQFAWHDSEPAQKGVFSGGLSGVAWAPEVQILSRVTQGCAPIGKERQITEAEGHVVYQLDGLPALDVLMADLKVSLSEPQTALKAVRSTLVGITSEGQQAVGRTGSLGADVRVRHIVGLDPARKGVAIAEHLAVGQKLAFCQMSLQAAKSDLRRICSEIREELEPETLSLEMANALAASEAEAAPHLARRIAGAVYVSCSGRGGPHFGGPSAELQWIRHALGDVPLVGFFASGEIAHHHLYGYTGVLTVFTTPEEMA